VFFLYGQEQKTFTVTLKSGRNDGPLLSKIDTVFLNSTFGESRNIYTNVPVADTSFTISDIPIGKHWLLFSTQTHCISPIPVVICSKCDNQFFFYASSKKYGDSCNLFQMMEIEPAYIGGNKMLSSDFQRSLSKKERKQVKRSSHFVVHFYLTKQGNISDPSFTPLDLPQQTKDVIIKGLKTAVNWQPATRNGTIADAEFLLNKQSLLNN
jgi:hypothetical protein